MCDRAPILTYHVGGGGGGGVASERFTSQPQKEIFLFRARVVFPHF